MPVRISSLAPKEDARGASFSIDLPFAGVGECHVAEVSFDASNGGPLAHSKHTEEGLDATGLPMRIVY